MMPLQRARIAEIGWKTSYQMDRGGCSERYMHIIYLVFCNVKAYVSCRGYVSILQAYSNRCKSRWHRGL